MAGRHPRISGMLAVIVVLALGVAAGWLVGGGDDGSGPTPAQAAEPVEFTPAAEVGGDEFTPAADIEGLVTIEGEGSFGGTGSNFVCDRERLIGFLEQRQDRLRAWARVQAIATTNEGVGEYIRGLSPATLLEPTRVTNHKFVNGRAVASQAILAEGTAVLVDENSSIRVRCRTGSPLLDPILADDQQCASCPANYRLPKTVRVASTYYAVHPAPPPTRNATGPQPPQPKQPVTIRIQRQLPPEYVVRQTGQDNDGRQVTRTVTQEKTKTVFRTRTRTVRVTRPARTRTVTRTVTVRPPAPQSITRTITVYEGAG
jgi:hypothetical protein